MPPSQPRKQPWTRPAASACLARSIIDCFTEPQPIHLRAIPAVLLVAGVLDGDLLMIVVIVLYKLHDCLALKSHIWK